MNRRKLYKSSDNKMVSGVCAGFAEYLGLDVSIVRIVWAVLCLINGLGVVAYIIAAVVLPEKDTNDDNTIDAGPDDYRNV